MFFNAWMVQYILLIAADETRNIRSSILGPYQYLRNMVVLTVYEMDKDTKKTIALLFIYSFNTNFGYGLCTYRYSSNSCCRWFDILFIAICYPKYNRSYIFAILFGMLIPYVYVTTVPHR